MKFLDSRILLPMHALSRDVGLSLHASHVIAVSVKIAETGSYLNREMVRFDAVASELSYRRVQVLLAARYYETWPHYSIAAQLDSPVPLPKNSDLLDRLVNLFVIKKALATF
jgi:hypothetical protein